MLKCVISSIKDFIFIFYINELLKMFIYFIKKYFSLFVIVTSKVKKKIIYVYINCKFSYLY